MTKPAEIMRVICVNVGDKYGPHWVYRLKRMCNRHLPPHHFVCLSDKAINGVNCVPAPSGLHGWWAKIGLFQPGRFPGRNIYFDLDVVLTADLSALVKLFDVDSSHLWAPDDFSYSLVKPKRIDPATRRLLGGDGTINSSVMLWRGDAARAVWDNFDAAVTAELHGDQNFITQQLWPNGLRLIPPEFVCSYKYHVLRGIRSAPIVVFHGEPKVSQLDSNHPLRQEWDRIGRCST